MVNPLHDRLFGRHAGRDTTFLIRGDGSRLSHAAFLDRAARFAGALRAQGLAPGDRLAVQVAKSADALALYAAAVQTGVVFLPLNTAYTAAEIGYFLQDAEAALFLCDPADESELGPVAAGAGAALRALGPDGTGSFAAMAGAPDHAAADRRPDDLAALLYTSGTTGRSKGAMLTQANLVSNAEVLAETWRIAADDVLLHALPIFHTHGLFVATNVMLVSGGAMIFLPRFEADAVIAALPAATVMMGVPTFYSRLLDDARLTRELTAHMRLFISGSAPLLEETHRRFEDRTGHALLERYGMTETNMNTSNPRAGPRRAGTVGLPLPGVELRLADPETGAAVAEGGIGEIEVRGPNVFAGYWRMPEKTREEFRPDGFFRTGDLGTIDAAGYLRIVGRAKDLIISGGFNVYPKEVELILDAQPGVAESAVIGVPHPDFGEGVVAVVAAAPGAAPLPDALAGAVSAGLAPFKRPKRYIIVDALPRNAMGKVQKAALRRAYADLFGA